MNTEVLARKLQEALADLQLLSTDFYQRWQDGKLHRDELTSYAEQYRHFEAALPGVLTGILAELPQGDAHRYVQQNLADETGSPTHLALFNGFASAVNAHDNVQPSPAMTVLLDTYRRQVNAGPAAGLGALVAYETQAPAIASSKGQGLRMHYDLTEQDTLFWDLHAEIDVQHGEWGTSALASLLADGTEAEVDAVITAAVETAQAWWGFLDERESLSTAPACA